MIEVLLWPKYLLLKNLTTRAAIDAAVAACLLDRQITYSGLTFEQRDSTPQRREDNGSHYVATVTGESRVFVLTHEDVIVTKMGLPVSAASAVLGEIR